MSMINDYKPWLDKFGFIQDNNEGRTSQNGVRFTAQYVRSLIRHGEMTGQEADRIADVLLECEVLFPGLLSRAPDRSGGQEGPDNIYSNLYIDSVLHTGFAKRFLKYGRDNPAVFFDAENEGKWYGKPLYYFLRLFNWGGIKYTYNTDNPGGWNTNAFMGRQWPMIVHAKAVAGEKLSLFDQIAWSIGILISAFDKNFKDGKALGWFQVMSLRGKSKITDWACKFWVKKFREQWPGGMGAVLYKYWYWQDDTNRHPDIKNLEGDYGDE